MTTFSIRAICLLHKKIALRSVKPLTDRELDILLQLYVTNYPPSYRPLMRSMGMQTSTFHHSIKRLANKALIDSQYIGNRKFFSLTPSGRLLLFQFAAALDKIVQEKLKEFGSNDELP